MIIVQVKLFATLRRHYADLALGEAMAVELPEGATVDELVEHLRLLPDEVKITFVNGIVRRREHVLSGGDEVGLFPPVGGG